MITAFGNLYHDSKCKISIKGQTFEGFRLEAGVRQGCPLSPLIYAVVAESLLDMIELEIPGTFVRAYADDTALVVQDFAEAAGKLEATFTEFETVAGLKLNMAKSVVVPLNANTYDDFEALKSRTAPGWAAMPVRLAAKYLGFQVGPGKEDSSWKAPYKKYCSRVGIWQDQPLGLYWDTRVYNTFAIPTLGYICQLESPRNGCWTGCATH